IVVSITYKDSDDVVSSDVEFEALPGRSYQTGFLSELESEYADLWVTDLDSGKAISTLSRAVFPKRKTTYVPMPIYTPQPTPIYAPIYTPLPMPY
ncbi:MAG: hypothetical protein HN661_00005, partial [Gammaproteobacteria bacterium]|nr:hypothetical protein [Gammaproteobacteria bacterium]